MSGAPRAPALTRRAPQLLLVGFVAGIVLALLRFAPVSAAQTVAVGALAGAAAALAARRPALAFAALLLAGAATGALWGTARIDATAPVTLTTGGWATGRVAVDTPPVPEASGGLRMRAVVIDATADGAALPAGARILLSTSRRGSAPAIGTVLRVAGRLRPAGDASSPAWWHRWLERQGIAARLRAPTVTPVGRRGGIAGLRDRWRTWAGENAGAGLHGDTLELVRGMALGAGGRLSQEVSDAFRDAGLWHLLAVSGQNITVVTLAVLVLLRALGVAHRPALCGAGLAMLAYCLACDGGASVARAGTVGALALIAELRGGGRERWTLLLAGLCLLLAWQPRNLWDPGLQMSFAAVAGMFLIAPPLTARASAWLPARVAELVALSVGAGLATAPVVAWHFGRISLVGFVVNIVAVPLAAPIVVIALAGLALGAVHPAAGVAAAHIAGLGADLLLMVARAGAAVPGASVAVDGGALILGLTSVTIVWALGVTALAGRRPRLDGARRPVPAAHAVVVCAAIGAVVWALWPRPDPAPWPRTPAITVLDVGQGDAILLRGPAGEAVLVDTGPPGSPAPVVRALGRHGVEHLDALVITHGDADHAGGAADLLDAVAVARVLHPPEPVDGWGTAMRATLAGARTRGVPAQAITRGTRLIAGPWAGRVLSPDGPVPAGGATNDGALVIDADAAGGPSALLTADAEGHVLMALALAPRELLKVSHHGSEDPRLADLLARVHPALAVISVGEGNPYRHPRPSVLDALADAGATVGRTDRDGDITVAGEGPTLRVAGLDAP